MPDLLLPEYTLLCLVVCAGVVATELVFLRTGIFRTAQFWLSMAIVMGFQVLVDGWLTKLSNPIVLYRREHMLGWRFPWDIPVEDFVFGFAMVTLAVMLWEHQNRNSRTTP